MKTVFGFSNDKKTNKSSVISNYVPEKSLVEGLLRIAKNGIPSTIKTSMIVYDEKTQQFYTGASVSGTPKKISDVIVVDSLASISEGQEGVLYVGLKECACAVWADNKLQTLYYTKDEIDNKIIKAITDDNTDFDLVTFLKKVDAEATYLKKADATVQDGSIIKASRTPAVNMEEIDKALAAETAARIGADKSQDKVIESVNKNLATSINTINQNVSNIVTALNQSDQTLQANIDDLAKKEKVTNDGFAVRRSDTVGQNLQNLDDAVKKEISDRTSADNTLQANITATAQKAASDLNMAKSTLQSNIDTNTAAIATNRSAIVTETTNRVRAIENESSERGAADQALKEDIDTVKTNYEAADRDLTNKINGVDAAYKAADLKISNDFSAAQTSLSNQISQVQTNLDTTNDNLSKEVENRTNKITLVQNNLQNQLNNVKTNLQDADTAEQEARLAADNEIKAAATTLTNEYNAFKRQYNETDKPVLDQKDKDLDAAIKAEATTARTAEQELKSKLSEAIKQHNTDKNTLENSISNEADRAKDAEAANLAKINQEVTDRTAADQELDTKIDQVNTAVTNEASARETAIQDVTNAYTAADTALEDKVTKAYKAADTNLKRVIDDEITAEANAREEVTTNLTNEIARAKGEENTLSTSIANEVAARTQAVKDVTNAYTEAVKTEADRAKAAESALQTNINATNTALNNLKNDSVVLYDADSSKAIVTLGGLTGTTITNLKDGAVSETSKDAVTGKQLNNTNNSISNLSTAIDTKLNAVKADLQTADATLQTNINNETTRATAAERALRMATDADIDAGAWSSKIATGTVASAETKAVSGDTVFTEVRVAKDGSIIKATNTAADNIKALDKEVADAKATLTGTISKNLEDTNEALNKKASVKFDNLEDVAHTVVKTDAIEAVKVSAGSHVNVALSTDSTLTDKTYVVKVLDGDVTADSAELVTGQKVYAAINDKATEVSGAADTKIQENADAITSLKDLTNLTDAGKAAAKALAKEAVVVTAGDRATVTAADDATGNKTYTVAVKNDGKVEENNTDLVSGDTVYKAMQTASTDTDAKLATKADVAGSNIDADAWSKKFAIGDIADTELKAVSGSKVAAAIAAEDKKVTDKVTALDGRLQTVEGKVDTDETTLGEHATKLSEHDEAIANLQTAASTDTVKAAAKEAISIAAGAHVTVTKDSTDAGKYTIAVKDGEIAADNADFVSGAKINTAIERAKSDLQANIDKKANASDIAASVLVQSLKTDNIAKDQTGFVNGDQAYKELRPKDGKYVLATNTTAANLKVIDMQVDANTTAIATNITAIAANKDSIDTLAKKTVTVVDDRDGAGNNSTATVSSETDDNGAVTYKISVPYITDLKQTLLPNKADVDARNIDKANWLSALKSSKGVEKDETSFVSGAQVFSYVKSETHPATLAGGASYNYIDKDSSAGVNLQALDTAIKANETHIATNKDSLDTLKTATDITNLFSITKRPELESLTSKKIVDVLAYLFDQSARLSQFALDDYEEVHTAVKPTDTIGLKYRPIGKIRIYINGKREFNNPNDETNKVFTYDSEANAVTFNSTNMGYLIGDGTDTVVFEYDYDRRATTD